MVMGMGALLPPPPSAEPPMAAWACSRADTSFKGKWPPPPRRCRGALWWC